MNEGKSTTPGTEIQVPIAQAQGTSPFDKIRHVDENGVEFWSAREMMPLMGYTRWNEFERAVSRAILSATAHGLKAGDHFRQMTEKASVDESRGRPRKNYRLSRRAAYLVAMNCDPSKAEVAAAQNYFAERTREAELRPGIDLASIVQAVANAVENQSKTIGTLANTAEVNTKTIDRMVADQASTNGRVAELEFEIQILKKKTDTQTSATEPRRRDPLDEPWMTVYEYCAPRSLPRDIETLKIQSLKLRSICGRRGIETLSKYVHEVKGYRRIYPKSLFDEFYSDPVNRRFRIRGDEDLPLFDAANRTNGGVR